MKELIHLLVNIKGIKELFEEDGAEVVTMAIMLVM